MLFRSALVVGLRGRGCERQALAKSSHEIRIADERLGEGNQIGLLALDCRIGGGTVKADVRDQRAVEAGAVVADRVLQDGDWCARQVVQCSADLKVR